MLGEKSRHSARFEFVADFLRPRWRSFERLESRRFLDADGTWLGDLNTTPLSPFPTQFLAAQDFVYFTASDLDHGNELWRTDGTIEGTMLIKDIVPGNLSSDIQITRLGPGSSFAIQGNILYFVANDGVHGMELWRSDGTPSGTHLVRDLCTCYSWPTSLQFVGDTLFFSAYNNLTGRELWKTDGTEAGTVLVKDVFAVGDGNIGSMHALRGQLLFSAIDGEHGREWWSSDGTAAGTHIVTDLNSVRDGVRHSCTYSGRCSISSIVHQDKVYFIGNDGIDSAALWVTDGTSAGTMRLSPATSSYSIGQLTSSGNHVFFTLSDEENGRELWVSDGTPNGTRLVRDIEPGPLDSSPNRLFPAGDFLYFYASQSMTGIELWRTDGSTAGTTLIELNPTGSSYPNGMAVMGDTFFFSASTGDPGIELWLTNRQETRVVLDGTKTKGPAWVRVANQRLIIAEHNVSGLFSIWGTDEKAQDFDLLQQSKGSSQVVTSWKNGLIYTDGEGRLWRTDGTRAGTRELMNGTQTQTSLPNSFTSFQHHTYFFAYQGDPGWGLFVHDSADAPKQLVSLLGSTQPTSLQILRDRLVFLSGGNLWTSDGTTAGTVKVTTKVADITEIRVAGDRLFLLTTDGLWTSDGTDAGTTLVRNNLNENSEESSAPESLTAVGNRVYFSAITKSSGRELWTSDGTRSGTAVVQNIHVTGSSDPSNLFPMGDILYFTADDGQSGREVWRTDGTAIGTQLVLDIWPGSMSSDPFDMKAFDSHLLFQANDGVHGRELWISDGMAFGTRLFDDFNERERVDGSSPSSFTMVGSNIYFLTGGAMWMMPSDQSRPPQRVPSPIAYSSTIIPVNERALFLAGNARETTLWAVDGTNAIDIGSNPFSNIGDFTRIGNTVYFTALSPTAGNGVWKTDGTRNGTSLVSNVVTINDDRQTMVAVGKTLYFVAQGESSGTELFKTDGTEHGTVLVRDINPGQASSFPMDLRAVGDLLFFSAQSADDGRELWVTDGTNSGTQTFNVWTSTSSSGPREFVELGGWTYFVATDSNQADDIWKTDGTASGTSRVTYLPGKGTIKGLQVTGNHFYFAASDTMFVSDGTSAGTRPISGDDGASLMGIDDITMFGDRVCLLASTSAGKTRNLYCIDSKNPGAAVMSLLDLSAATQPRELTVVGDQLFVVMEDGQGGRELWQTDGTRPGTHLVEDIFGSVSTALPPRQFIQIDGEIFFTATDRQHSTELWVTDGTAVGTRRVDDLFPGTLPNDSEITEMMTVGSQIFLSRTEATTGSELWVSQGTAETTRLVRDIFPGTQSSYPRPLTVWRDQLVFLIWRNPERQELWISDGTERGTRPLDVVTHAGFGTGTYSPSALVYQDRLIVWTGGVTPGSLYRIDSPEAAPLAISDPHVTNAPRIVGDRLYYSAYSPEFGVELWTSDGTREGARMVVDVNTSSLGSNPEILADHENWVYFQATDSLGQHLFRANGSSHSIQKIAGLTLGYVTELRSSTNGLYLTQSGISGQELWRLTTAPTPTAELIVNEASFFGISVMDVVDDRLFFKSFDPLVGIEIWVTDGTALGTRLVRDLRPGPESSGIQSWHPMPNPLGIPMSHGLVFVTNNSGTGDDLWFTDGTDAGTFPIAEVNSIQMNAPLNLTVLGNQILFSGNDGQHGWEPWISDGTREGTRMLANLSTSTESSNLSWLTIVGSDLYFVLDEQPPGQLGNRRLWRWSSAEDEWQSVSDRLANPSNLTNVDGTLYFTADDPETGHELWLTDGTAKGTRLVADLWPGRQGAYPLAITGTGTGLYFSAIDATHGREAWWLSPLEGDTNADREVNFVDFLALAYHFGNVGTRKEGDLNDDGHVDFVDLRLLAENYGRSSFDSNPSGMSG